MKRLITGLFLSVAACGTGPLTLDAGVDAGSSAIDAGPTEVPARPDLGRTILDRAGRPFVAELLLTRPTPEAENTARSLYNSLPPVPFPGLGVRPEIDSASTSASLILENLPLFDAMDGLCGAGTLTSSVQDLGARYGDLANLLTDDQIWLDLSDQRTVCQAFFAVERRELGLSPPPEGDCGGRAPDVDALDKMLEVLTATATSDGVAVDTSRLSSNEPFFELP